MFYFFSHPQSLHYLSPDGANQYTQAIQSVGEIIEPYDTDKQFPALGFGAKVPPHGQVSFEFFLNLAQNPYCNGVQGILQAYRTALGQVNIDLEPVHTYLLKVIKIQNLFRRPVVYCVLKFCKIFPSVFVLGKKKDNNLTFSRPFQI